MYTDLNIAGGKSATKMCAREIPRGHIKQWRLPMTLKEIAKMAGVSASTVSRVINHSNEKVASKEVRDRIWRIVRETNYVPNQTAQKLKLGNKDSFTKNSSKTIGCIFARSLDTLNDPFFSNIARAIEQEAFRQGYVMKYSFSAYDINDPQTYQIISNYQVNGIAVLGRFDKNLLSFIQKQYKHVVYTGLNLIDTGYDQIICNGYDAAKTAVNYLAKLGHEKIGYIGEKKKEVRYLGYLDAMKNLNLPIKNENIIISTLNSESGYKYTMNYLKKYGKKHNTAFFCANDVTAIGALKAIKEYGLTVPTDISLISIDNINTAQYVSPMLTTINIPMEELGKMTAKILIDRIENGKTMPIKVELPFSIVVRESCNSLS